MSHLTPGHRGSNAPREHGDKYLLTETNENVKSRKSATETPQNFKSMVQAAESQCVNGEKYFGSATYEGTNM
jgi:hypothetical protein